MDSITVKIEVHEIGDSFYIYSAGVEELKYMEGEWGWHSLEQERILVGQELGIDIEFSLVSISRSAE